VSHDTIYFYFCILKIYIFSITYFERIKYRFSKSIEI